MINYVATYNRLFHWESQSTTSANSPTGQRHIRHREQGYTPLLFVREWKTRPGGLAAPTPFASRLTTCPMRAAAQ